MLEDILSVFNNFKRFKNYQTPWSIWLLTGKN